MYSASPVLKQMLSWRYFVGGGSFIVVLIFLSSYVRQYERADVGWVPAPRHHDILSNIGNETLGFEKIFAVSLPERTDHRDGLILAFDAINVLFEFVDGVHGEVLPEKALPPGHANLKPGNLGSWRAHINALSRVVKQNYSTALILEDDMDWDVRLRDQLRDFARSAHALARAPTADQPLNFAELPPVAPPTTSPYGDDWDVLWLGHCGAKAEASDPVVAHYGDASVPAHVERWDKADLLPAFPVHTRVVTRHIREPVCSMAYAVSRRGARRLLHALGVRTLNHPFDIMLARWCMGVEAFVPAAGEAAPVCAGVLPALFKHWRTRGSLAHDSDISKHKGTRDEDTSPNVRWSVRKNLQRIWRGNTEYEDQYPDDKQS